MPRTHAIPRLRIDRLSTELRTGSGWIPAVHDVSLDLGAGEMLALVGESGCGKSLTAMSLLRLLPWRNARTRGQVLLDGENLLELPERRMRRIRGGRIGMIFQEPMTSLNPVMTIGAQVAESARLHRGLSRKGSRAAALEMLSQVRIADPRHCLGAYPHQLSGGMRQRAMIAMAMVARPGLLIADEPTTALDVTVQAQILDLMRILVLETKAGMLLITHDLGIVAEYARRVAVMYAGRIIEEASTAELFRDPWHPYARGLLAATPRLGAAAGRARGARLAEIPGSVPGLQATTPGCGFAPRCGHAIAVCHRSVPALVEKAGGRRIACHLAASP